MNEKHVSKIVYKKKSGEVMRPKGASLPPNIFFFDFMNNNFILYPLDYLNNIR